MAKRIDKTLADLVVAALMPALLIGLLTSLVYFLLELAYSGQYIGQMKNVLLFFIVGAVLIARITMMGDIADRAGLYGVALAIAAGLALVRFVDMPTTFLPGLGWIIPVTLMAMIWWSAHKLTLDCTWDDDTDQAEAGGLLDKNLLTQTLPSKGEGRDGGDGNKIAAEKKQDWFDHYQSDRQAEQKRKKPGTMVIYFSLAALPLFGLGQAILPANDLERRRYAFWLLAIYMACGLGLLLTTSFLGLRRYLRARKLQMPAAMTGFWLALGAVLILALLFLGSIIPRPEAEYSLTNLLGWVGSKERDANRVHFFEGSSGKSDESGKGPRDRNQQQQQNAKNKQGDQGKQPGQRGGNQPGNTGKQQRSEQSQSGESQEKGQNEQGNNQSQSGQGNRKGNNQSGNQNGQQKGQQGQQSDQAKEGEGGKEEKQRGENGKKDQREEQGQLMKGNKQQKQQEKEQKNEGIFGQQEKQQRQQIQQENQSASSPPEPTSSASWDWLKWIVYAVLILGAIYAFYRWGKELWLALVQMWQEFLTWWRGLWLGGKRGGADDALIPEPEVGIPLQPFSWFSNPLLEPQRFRSMEEMIRYSFAALHSWAYEQNLGREKGETPTEFATRLGAAREAWQQEIRKLADLYAVVTYAGRKAPASSETILRNFWNRIPAPMGQVATT